MGGMQAGWDVELEIEAMWARARAERAVRVVMLGRVICRDVRLGFGSRISPLVLLVVDDTYFVAMHTDITPYPAIDS